MRARLDIARGDLASAEEWAQGRGLHATDDVTYLREYDHLTLVRLLLAQHRAAGEASADRATLDAVLGLLERLQADAEPSRHGSLLEIGVLTALTHHAGGDLSRALAALDHAFTRAPEPEAYVRLFLDEGAAMLDLLQAVVAGTEGEQGASREAVRRHAGRLLAAASHDTVADSAATPGPGDRPTTHQGTLVDPLSDRELEVLRLLDSGLTGPEIARQLFVSLNTLRTHTRHIFAKLEVTSRSGAVRRGRSLGLL
jgi:LuxR family maltose regulon positive regulatory protein